MDPRDSVRVSGALSNPAVGPHSLFRYRRELSVSRRMVSTKSGVPHRQCQSDATAIHAGLVWVPRVHPRWREEERPGKTRGYLDFGVSIRLGREIGSYTQPAEFECLRLRL